MIVWTDIGIVVAEVDEFVDRFLEALSLNRPSWCVKGPSLVFMPSGVFGSWELGRIDRDRINKVV